MRPNVVTILGILLAAAASYGFATGQWAASLTMAWLMTFLDTVDGKLARVTHTSSRLGNLLDHGTDIIHPPLWWICVALGLTTRGDMPAGLAWIGCSIIVACYLAGRLSEAYFKVRFGFNQYTWRPFDMSLRLVIARRNPNLAILTVGALVHRLPQSYVALAAWSVLSIGAQCARTLIAGHQQRSGKSINPCLELA